MTIAWVIGSGGLLGSALCFALKKTEANLYTFPENFCWNNEAKLDLQLKAAVKSFTVAAGSENSWQIYWAAGVGTMHSLEGEIRKETRILASLLNLIQSEPSLLSLKGCFIFSSSAGAIYAGVSNSLINENTPIAPTTAYAREKLKQEKIVNEFGVCNCSLVVLIARVSTLYGPGQAIGKQQGLIAEIARRVLRNQAIMIYVPFDTIRDYIYVNDAAYTIIFTAQALSNKIGIFIKIVASEKPVTIAEIISIYKRINRRSPRIIVGTSKESAIYTRSIQFRSITTRLDKNLSRTSLDVGIAQVMAAERLSFAKLSIK